MSAGDLTLTVAVTKTLPGFTLIRLDVDLAKAVMAFHFVDALGSPHVAIVGDAAGSCSGFDVTGNAIADSVGRPAVTGEYTKLIGIIFGAATGNANARRTAAVQTLKDDGIITVVGTVG